MRFSIGSKIIASFVFVIVVCGGTGALVGIRMVASDLADQVQNKVRLDLNSARLIYLHAAQEVRYTVDHHAAAFSLKKALARGEVLVAARKAVALGKGKALDVLFLCDLQGRQFVPVDGSNLTEFRSIPNEIARKALAKQQSLAATEVVSRETLLLWSGDLAKRARTLLVPTHRARPTDRREESSGMVLAAAAPITDEHGKVIGALYGARLLNKDHDLADKIKATVYQEETYNGKDMGTATVFLGDVRIATNVLTKSGERSVGTRVSEEVFACVLERGERWIERAYVVNETYIAAYEPIRDINSHIVGILYVGMLGDKFEAMKLSTLWTYAGITLGAITLALVLSLFLTRAVVRPLKTLAAAARSLASGDLEKRVDEDSFSGEIAGLAHAFNVMALSLEQRDALLQEKAEHEMQEKMQKQLRQSEKLASLGQLVSGVAHEINNPVQFIMGNVEIVREALNDAMPILDEHARLHPGMQIARLPYDVFKKELPVLLEDVAHGAAHIRNIVKDLKTFARRDEGLLDENVDLNEVIRGTLRLVHNKVKRFRVDTELAPDLPTLRGNSNKLQQVVVNTLINAADALGAKRDGTIQIVTDTSRDGRRVRLTISDNGPGMAEDVRRRIFDPFFTTKQRTDGTGLGLSITYGIIEQHGGSIVVESHPGQGTTFLFDLAAGEATI